MSPEPLNTAMPGLEALAEEFRQTAQAAEVRSQSDPLWVNDRVAALKRALAPDVEDLIFADGDIIAWRMPEMMTTETVHRTAVYSASVGGCGFGVTGAVREPCGTLSKSSWLRMSQA